MAKTAEATAEAAAMGKRIKARRLKMPLTQKELAKTVGCAQQTVLDLEYGKVEYSRYLKDIADALHVSLHWLQTGEGRPDRPDIEAMPVGVVPWSYFTDLANGPVLDPPVMDWIDGCPVPHAGQTTVVVHADEAAAFALQGEIVQGEWLFVDTQRADEGLVICIMAGWHRAELRRLTPIGGRWFLKSTNPALGDLVAVSPFQNRNEYNAALQVPGQDALPCLVLGRVVFHGAPS